MKKVTRLFAMLLTILTLSSICIPIAAQATETYEQTTITQFGYTILDKDGNVIERGITPNFRARYSWSGIKIKNGQSIIFDMKGTDFLIGSGRRIFFKFTLDRFAETKTSLSKRVEGKTYYETVESTRAQGQNPSLRYDIAETGYYFMDIQNMSSDPITVTSAELTF
ncbi:hypothetical protein [Oscillibacter sp.]|uniref:hypothetical protein n=1 Tax=Oscillibacter sp. TaxID=1945593 RepID=UPI00289D4B6F|nr:hypothetical protein [Oscillibacter sp.]